jgi:hypothetical protein
MVAPGDALLTMTYVLIVALVAGCWAISRRQYVLTS